MSHVSYTQAANLKKSEVQLEVDSNSSDVSSHVGNIMSPTQNDLLSENQIRARQAAMFEI